MVAMAQRSHNKLPLFTLALKTVLFAGNRNHVQKSHDLLVPPYLSSATLSTCGQKIELLPRSVRSRPVVYCDIYNTGGIAPRTCH